jgi:hypothetical protein
MTDFESEKFYQDLRQKLDGFGSAPPEAVWESIRAQVPVRKRRRRPALLLLLLGTLIVGLTVGTGQWQPFSVSAPGALPAGPAVSQARVAGDAVGGPAEAAGASAPLATASTTPIAATNASAADAAGTPALGAPHKPALGAPHSSAGTVGVPSPAGGRTFRRATPSLLAAPSTRTKRSARKGAETENTASARTAASVSAKHIATASRATARNRARRKAGRATGLIAGNSSTRVRTARIKAGSSEAEALARTRHASRSLANRSSQTAATGLSGTEATGKGARKARIRQPKISNAPLALLVVRPAVKQPEEPEVRAARRSPRRRPTRREIRLRNWSAQLLLGSGLTYRIMGGAPTQLERLERPSLGFSGQATATYALSRQLSVAAGLGYAEYATALHYQLKKTASETMVQKDFRDVYRYLTIPVQAQLTLAGNPRWRYGVLGGGTVAILADAQTTEGSACNCQQVQWSTSTQAMPFSRTNLVLTGGVFASYQFGLGQWLTVRPQGQVFLNSITTPASGRTARRPWNLGVQAGYSWDLDPRKR